MARPATPTVPLLKRLRRAVLARVVLAVGFVLSLLPLQAALGLGARLGGLAFRLAGKDRRHALANLALAFPELDETARKQLLHRTFQHLGVTAMEVIQQQKLDPRMQSFVEFAPAVREAFDRAVATKRGVVVFSGHAGSWEQLARALGLAYRGKGAIVAAEMLYPALRDWAYAWRRSGAIHTIWRGRPGAKEEIRKHVENGGFLGLLIDQDTRSRNVFVPFFGHLAATPRGGAELVLDTNAMVIACFDHRRADGTHILEGGELVVPKTGDREADLTALVADVTQRTEEAIRRHPEQWVWTHRRWKTRPADEPKS